MTQRRLDPGYVKLWQEDANGPNFLQILVVCGDHMRNLWVGIKRGELRRLRNADKWQSADFARTWMRNLKLKLEYGRPTGSPTDV